MPLSTENKRGGSHGASPKKRRGLRICGCLRVFLMVLIAFITAPLFEATADNYRTFALDSKPEVWINRNTFWAAGFPNNQAWQLGLTDSVINAITRWTQVAGGRVTPIFKGYTTATAPQANQILVMANESHFNEGRLASAFGTSISTGFLIVVHRRGEVGGTPHNYVPYHPASGQIGLEAVLTHEFGHVLGIWVHSTTIGDLMYANYSRNNVFGPTPNDRDALISLYGYRTNQKTHGYRSTDNGVTWTNAMNLQNISWLHTTTDVGAVRDGSSSEDLLVTFTTSDKVPGWIKGASTSGAFGGGTVFGGLRSFYGTAVAGKNNKYLWGWVDPQTFSISLVRSTDGAQSWQWTGLPTTYTRGGRPGICYLGGSTWVLAYVNYAPNDFSQSGRIYARVSTNDGVSFGPAYDISNSGFYKSTTGLSCAAGSSNDVRIGFTWAANGIYDSGTTVLERTIWATVSGTEISYTRVITSASEYTRNSCGMARNNSSFHRICRTPNTATTISHTSMPNSGTAWIAPTNIANVQTGAGPGLAADPSLPWMFMFAAKAY